jgi:hypothetical protein
VTLTGFVSHLPAGRLMESLWAIDFWSRKNIFHQCEPIECRTIVWIL